MAQVQLVKKLRRWDKPFGRERMRPDVVSELLSLPFFQDIVEDDFPEDLALGDIVANDGRILRYNRGDIVYRSGEYGTSVFVVLSGSIFGAASTLGEQAIPNPLSKRSSRGDSLMRRLGYLSNIRTTVSRVHDVDGLVAEHPADVIGPNDIFGECEALKRGPRANTHFAGEDETLVLELRWPGAREIRHWSDQFRNLIDARYRERSLWRGLRNCSLFEHLSDNILRRIYGQCIFETCGTFDWAHRHQRNRAEGKSGQHIIGHEEIIAEEGHYLDDIILIHAGFARLGETFEHSEKTLGYVRPGDVIGLEELRDSARGGERPRLRHTLRAVGYTGFIRIPAHMVEQYALGEEGATGKSKAIPAGREFSGSLLDFAIDNRFINGTQAMVVNLDRCVNCDDCVRACAATHDNMSRFVRQGPSHQNIMIAHACMHCADPVCLIDCPTAAIHRDSETGNVVIDEGICIGCATCASACPYGNIRMEEVRNRDGAFHINFSGVHVSRATKCDLCTGRQGGPACQNACPHNALIRVDLQDAHAVTQWLEHAH